MYFMIGESGVSCNSFTFEPCNAVVIGNKTNRMSHCNALSKQGTVLRPFLNNCSLDRVCKTSLEYHKGSVEIKSMKFVNDNTDPNSDEISAIFSDKIVDRYSLKNVQIFQLSSVSY